MVEPPVATETAPVEPEEIAPKEVPVAENSPAIDPLDEIEEAGSALEGPSEEDLAEYLGASGGISLDDGNDAILPDNGELPKLAEVENRIPVKTRALMEELFRAKLEKVQRIDPKKIR